MKIQEFQDLTLWYKIHISYFPHPLLYNNEDWTLADNFLQLPWPFCCYDYISLTSPGSWRWWCRNDGSPPVLLCAQMKSSMRLPPQICEIHYMKYSMHCVKREARYCIKHSSHCVKVEIPMEFDQNNTKTKNIIPDTQNILKVFCFQNSTRKWYLEHTT